MTRRLCEVPFMEALLPKKGILQNRFMYEVREAESTSVVVIHLSTAVKFYCNYFIDFKFLPFSFIQS